MRRIGREPKIERILVIAALLAIRPHVAEQFRMQRIAILDMECEPQGKVAQDVEQPGCTIDGTACHAAREGELGRILHAPENGIELRQHGLVTPSPESRMRGPVAEQA